LALQLDLPAIEEARIDVDRLCHDRDAKAYRNVNIRLHVRLTLVTAPTTRPDIVLLVRVLLRRSSRRLRLPSGSARQTNDLTRTIGISGMRTTAQMSGRP
jgi:hypothetical protein